jgi:hypothetical protein
MCRLLLSLAAEVTVPDSHFATLAELADAVEAER